MRACSRDSATKKAPSRWRLRPAIRLTSAEASATRRAINLGRSVLGAATTLGDAQASVKHPRERISRNFRPRLRARAWHRDVPIRQRCLPRRQEPGSDPRHGPNGRGEVCRERVDRSTTAHATRRRSTKKCTEPVTPSSGFPTDLRRSDCHSESHQPRALRTRCTQDSRAWTRGRQGPSGNQLSQIATFSFHKGQTAHRCACSSDLREEKAAGPEGPAADSPSRERFRPPSRRTFRFRVVLLGGLRPTGAPCSAQAGHYASRTGPTRASAKEILRYLR
jgi:hypothetical protein